MTANISVPLLFAVAFLIALSIGMGARLALHILARRERARRSDKLAIPTAQIVTGPWRKR